MSAILASMAAAEAGSYVNDNWILFFVLLLPAFGGFVLGLITYGERSILDQLRGPTT